MHSNVDAPKVPHLDKFVAMTIERLGYEDECLVFCPNEYFLKDQTDLLI